MLRIWFALILSFIASCRPVFAQNADGDYVARNQVYEINDFSKLQSSSVSPYSLQEGAAISAVNLRSNITVGSLNKRPIMQLYGDTGSDPVKTVYKYYKSDSTKHLIASANSSLYAGNDSNGSFTTIKDGLTAGKRFQCVTYKDKLICSNGFDNIQKWDGSCSNTSDVSGARSSGACTTDLGAAFASQATGSNLDATSWYQYRIAYFNGTNFWFSSNKSNPIQTGSTLKGVTLTDIPLGPAGTTYRYIYRTVGNASKSGVIGDTSYYLLASINDNSTQTYTDNIADATITADAAPTWATASGGINATPPHGKFLTIHQERLFIANDNSGTPQGKSTVYFSNSFLPDYVLSSSNYIIVRADDGDEITFIKTFLSKLTIGKTNTIQKLYTESTNTSDWELSNPFSFVGCPSPYTATVTPFGIVYLGRDGLYSFEGQSSKLYSDRVTDVMRDINQVNIAEAVGEYFQNEYHLSYTSSETGSAVNDRILVFDSSRDSFSIDYKSIDSFAVANAGTDYGSLIMGSSLTDGNVLLAQQTPSTLIFQTATQLSSGATFDAVIVGGTETAPMMELGWDVTWGAMTGTWADQAGTWEVRKLTGYWYSPITKVNAKELSKLYWNELLEDGTDVTFAIRSGDSIGAVNAASFSSEFSDPSGSDLTALTANNYIQIRAKLSTDAYTKEPVIYSADNYVIKLVYSQQGAPGESDYLSYWQSGFTGLGDSYKGYKKRIRAIDISYTGTSGTLTFGIKNSEGDINTSFNIDLSQAPQYGWQAQYSGFGDYKSFHWEPPMNAMESPTPIGENWQFSISETGVNPWKVQQFTVIYDVMPRNNP